MEFNIIEGILLFNAGCFFTFALHAKLDERPYLANILWGLFCLGLALI